MNRILEACLADKWFKLLALGLAVITWVYVNSRTVGSAEKDVELVFKDPPNYFILARHRTMVRATVEGPRADVRSLPKTLLAEIDVAEKKKGSFPTDFDVPPTVKLSLARSDIRNLPPRVTIKFKRDEVRITLDKIEEKWLPVEVDDKKDLNIQVAEGFEVHKFYWSPKHVYVRGPKSVLAKMESIRPLPIVITGLSGPLQTDQPLDTTWPIRGRGKPVKCLQPRTPNIRVLIEVIPKREKAKIRNVLLEVRGLPGLLYTVFTEDKTKLFTEVAEVEILGPKKALDDPRVRAFVDLTDIKDPKEKPEVKRKLQFSAEPDIEVLTKPPSVVVQIKAGATE